MTAERSEGIATQIQVNRGKFEYYNQVRLKKLYDSVEDERKLDLLESIPFLLISNQRELPGYVEYPRMLTGIHGYYPSNRALSFLKSRFPSANLTVPGVKEPFIQMFALMGSGGTIAFNKDSDFDFWVCADVDEYDETSVAMFKKKCHEIENWAAEKYNTEVHFFLNDIARVRRNIFDDDSEETLAGSSLGELLKEEFFRSSIVLCGKYPFWWVVPPDANDAVYEQWLAAAREAGLDNSFIDLGNLYTVIREDFLGAALFQILKSLGNPFKSIIKLGLLERYLSSAAANPFISNIIKRNVHEERLEVDHIDSYVIMFNQVFSHYASVVKDDTAIDLLQTCFYLKVNPRASSFLNAPAAARPEKVQKMLSYAQLWKWHESDISRIDNFENWDIDSVNKLWNNTKKYILRGYKNILTRIQDSKNSHHITEEELRSISRKIYSHFSVSDNKIDNSLTFKNYPPEKLLTVEFIRDREGNEFWVLSKRVITDNYPMKIIIHKEKNLLNLIVWVGLNKLFQKDYTRMEIAKGLYTVDPSFLRELILEVSLYFSYKRLELHNSYFLRDPFPVVSLLLINPFSKYAKKIEDIYFLYHNSWGETKYERFSGEAGLPQIITSIFSGSLRARLDFPSALRLIASQPYGSSREFDRLHQFLGDAYDFLIEQRSTGRRRYVTMLGNTYYVFTLMKSGGEESIVCGAYDSEIKMLYSLSYNTGIDVAIRVDPTILELAVLRKILENRKEGMVQIYFQFEHKYCYFYVCDERGAIVFIRKTKEAHVDYLARLYLFLQNTVKQVVSKNPGSPLAGVTNPIAVYRLERNIHYNCTLAEFNPELDGGIQFQLKKILPFTLSIHLVGSGEIGYRLTLPDGGFSDIYSGKNIGEISREIRVLMQSVPGYSFYSTDINLNAVGIRLYRDYTSFALSEKNRFELLVERSMG